MLRNLLGTWGLTVAGALFLVAAILTSLPGRAFNAAFFVIGIALLVIGAGVARKRRAGGPPEK